MSIIIMYGIDLDCGEKQDTIDDSKNALYDILGSFDLLPMVINRIIVLQLWFVISVCVRVPQPIYPAKLIVVVETEEVCAHDVLARCQ